MASSNRRTTDKRERILSAAVKIFAHNGFYNAKVSQVAEAAGVADGTIYLYFKNKDDLLISAFEDRMQQLIDRLQTELARIEGGALLKVRRCIELHLRLAIEERELAEFITVELRQSSKFIKEYKNRKFVDYLGILRGVLEQGQQEGSIDPDLDINVVARALFGAFDEQLLALVLRREVSADLIKARVTVLERLFFQGLRNPAIP